MQSWGCRFRPLWADDREGRSAGTCDRYDAIESNRCDTNVLTSGWRIDHHAVTDVDAYVRDGVVEVHEVAGLDVLDRDSRSAVGLTARLVGKRHTSLRPRPHREAGAVEADTFDGLVGDVGNPDLASGGGNGDLRA